MAREHLAGRANWQRRSAVRGSEVERSFDAIMRAYTRDTRYDYEHQPSDLHGIYGAHPASGRPHGIRPDAVVRNTETGRSVFIEVKRQGDRGNAHERACKYFTPGIIASACEIARQPAGVIPFWWIFANGIATSARYVQEIRHWFLGVEGHLLLWQSIEDYEPLIQHFEQHIQPLLD